MTPRQPDATELFAATLPEILEEIEEAMSGQSAEAIADAVGNVAYRIRSRWLADQDGLLPWVEDPDVPGVHDPDPLPVDALPSILRDHVSSAAASVQIAPEMAVLFSLAAVSAAAAGKFEVRVDDAWTREWLSFYAVAILAPGERKSAIFAALTNPLREWQDERRRIALPKHRAALDVVEVRERELAKAKEAAAKGGTLEAVEAARFSLEEAQEKVPQLPELLASDSTPEALVRQMAQQGGRVAVLSPEGGPLRILDGRYSEAGARLEELCHGYDGEPIDTHRVGRECQAVKRPALTLGVCVQPSVLETIQNGKSMRGQGLFGRISWCRPESGMGERKDSGEVPALDGAASERYGRMLHALLDAEPVGTDPDGTPIPHVLRLSPEATAIKRAFHYETEKALRAGGALSGISDWAGKAVGRAIRIAALLDLAERAGARQPLNDPISGPAMESGVGLTRALTSQALSVFGAMDLDRKSADLSYVLKHLRELQGEKTVRNLFDRVRERATVATVEELHPLLDELVDRGCIRLRESPAPGRAGGRRRSPLIELHPDLTSRIHPRTTRTTPPNSGSVGSAGVTAPELAGSA